MCVGLAAVEVPPSPKVQAYDAMVPSGSLEPLELKALESPLTWEVNCAIGLTLGVSAPVAAAWCVATSTALSSCL